MKPCIECPFLKGAVKDWHGEGLTADDLLRATTSEHGMNCHMSNTKDCIGSLYMAKSLAKKYRDIERNDVIGKLPVNNCVMTRNEFLEYYKEG